MQNEFYARYVKALLDTGYEGEILASNRQAGRAFSHYYNLHSDSLVGLIDHHNYFGGGQGTINMPILQRTETRRVWPSASRSSVESAVDPHDVFLLKLKRGNHETHVIHEKKRG